MQRSRQAGLALVAGALAVIPALALAATPRTVLTSVGPNQQVNGTSSTFWRSLSGNGTRALFTVDDDGLPGADGTRDVYLRDLETEKTRLVSRASGGDPASESSGDDPAISGNGRFVAFSTGSANLPGGEGGIFVRDLKSKRTRLVSVNNEGEPAGGSAGRPVLSANGRFVSFEADDDDLPGEDGTLDAYIHDREKGKTSLISKATDGTPVDTDSPPNPSVSGSGRFVAFESDSDVLPGADAAHEVFLRDRRKGTTTLISRTPGGGPAPGQLGGGGAVSSDGRFVAFESSAASLGAHPSGSAFLRDRERKTTRLASRTAEGDAAIGTTASVSANGRYVVYESEDDELAGTDGTTDVFRYDRKMRKTILLSRSSGGQAGADDSFYVSISGGGGFVAFSSRADNLSGQDDNTVSNTFVRGPLG